jgi:hypothetical protein
MSMNPFKLIRLSLLVLPLLVSNLYAQSVKLPDTVRVAPGRLAQVTIEWDGDDIKWDVPKELDAFREYDPDPKKVRLRVVGYTKGKFRLLAVVAKDKKLSDVGVCLVDTTEGEPIPPDPGPNPPTPPTPVPPAPVSGKACLILYETQDTNLPTGQHSIIFGEATRKYLTEKVESTNGVKNRGFFDKDLDISGYPTLQKLKERYKSSDKLPWVYVGSSKGFYEGPLPEDPDKFLEVARKYLD